jgi:glycosyltransferase involved in cell wall biosynthesis
MSVATNPILVALLAGPGAWLVYQFTPPPDGASVRQGLLWSGPRGVAKRIERRRRRRGGGVRITTPNEACRAAWTLAAPFLDPAIGPTAGSRFREPLADARTQLGFDASESLALVYGFPHAEKDLAVVDRAFAGLEDWRLVVAGQKAVAYRKLPPIARVGPSPILFPGHLDDATVGLLHSAADLAVLSFEPNYERESGTLLEAISWGLPVVCSGQSEPATAVARFHLGKLFEPGDAEALAHAVRSAPKRLDPEDLQRARNELSCRAVALRYVGLFEELTNRARA